MTVLEKINQATEYILAQGEVNAKTGIILGTGLGNLVTEIDVEKEIEYSDIPHFPLSTVESHSGKLIFGKIDGHSVIAMLGRFHFYEGYDMNEVVFPVRVMKFLGIERLFISNAAGSLNARIDKGDLMIIRDHINLQPSNPVIGRNFPEIGFRFPDPLKVYDAALIEKGLAFAKENGIACHKGVYVSVPGPVLETPAEYNYLNIIGGDAVGMSTVPEVIAACHMRLPVFGVSVITDKGFPIEDIEPVTVEEVIAVAREAEPKMTKLLKELIVNG